MVNWCENYLEITGESESIALFKKRAKSENTDLSLDNLYPLSIPFSEDTRDWCFERWGNGYDIEAELSIDNFTELSYHFFSLSTPPVNWMQKASKDFPTLSFRLRYDATISGLIGIATTKNGVVHDRWLEVN